MRNWILVLALVACVHSEIVLKSSVSYDDLEGNDHLNNMLANSIVNQRHYVTDLPESVAELSAAFDYKFFSVTPNKLHRLQEYLANRLGPNYHLVANKLDTIVQENKSQFWHTYMHLEATPSGSTKVSVVLLRWDNEKNHFDGHVLKSRKHLETGLKQSHLIEYSSEFGMEAGQATLIAEEESDESALAYAVSKKLILLAFQELTIRRGVDPRNPTNEMRFKSYIGSKSHKMALKLEPVTTIIAAAAVVKLAAELYKIFANIFATKVTTTLIGEYKAKGFSHYSLNADTRRFYGIKGSMMDTFTTTITKMLTDYHPDAEKQRKVKAAIGMIEFVEDQAWTMDDVAIDTGRPDSSDRFFTIISNRENFGEKYNFVSMNVKSTFTLAPNLLIYKQTKSVFGGLFGGEKAIIEEVPRQVTSDDVKAMRAFNIAMACKLFSDVLPGEKVAFPPL